MSTKSTFERSALLDTRQIFRLLVFYRWFSLIPVLVAAGTGDGFSAAWGITLIVALGANIFITLFYERINHELTRRPLLLLADIVLCAGLFVLTSGWATPYYLYAFSPLLAAGFFFGLRGALQLAAGMSAVYILAGLPGAQTDAIAVDLVVRLVGFFLIAGTFGYATISMSRLQATHRSLRQAHRDLEVIHSLTLSLQLAVDVVQVQERVLAAVTDELGFPHALIGLVDQDDSVITGWLGKSRVDVKPLSNRVLHAAEVPLNFESGIISASLILGEPRLSARGITTPDERLSRVLEDGEFHVLPMLLRNHAVGILLVGSLTTDDRNRMDSLQSITSQASVAIGTTMLCIDRATRLAVQDERIRFAREIHDTVAQSLFGISLALDACMKLLPGSPERVREELGTIATLAESTRKQVRNSIMDIWPSELTAEGFRNELQTYASESCRANKLDFKVLVHGNFQRVPLRARQDLYRIAQESVSNITRHAAAKQAKVCVCVSQNEVVMAVCDNGRGFNVDEILDTPLRNESFGLRGIQERVTSLNGSTDFISQPGGGTMVLVNVPLKGAQSYE